MIDYGVRNLNAKKQGQELAQSKKTETTDATRGTEEESAPHTKNTVTCAEKGYTSPAAHSAEEPEDKTGTETVEEEERIEKDTGRRKAETEYEERGSRKRGTRSSSRR